MTRPDHRPRRVLHVLAAFDPNEAQGCCVATIASRVPGEHVLVCSGRKGGGDEVFSAVVETGEDLWGFGWRDRSAIADAVRRHAPDLIHFHGGPIGAATMSMGWTLGVPSVASIYGWPTVTRRSWGRGVRAGHLRRTPVLSPRSFGNTLAPAVALGASLRHSGVRVVLTPDREIGESLAHQAIPVGTFRGITPARPRHERRATPGRFVFAGRAELTRGPDLLARAIGRLRAEGREVSADFFFLGTRDEQMVAAAASVPGCTVSVGGTDLVREMDDAVAVVLPFRFDTTTLSPAMVATEAMSCGVPIVGGDVRCLRSAVDHDRTGLLVAPNDVAALSAALARLHDDGALATRLGAAARDEIERRWRHSSIVELAEWAYMVAATGQHSTDPAPISHDGNPIDHKEAS